LKEDSIIERIISWFKREICNNIIVTNMNLENLIKQGELFKNDAELDYSGDPAWINDSNLDKYQQWEHCVLMIFV